MKFAVKLIQKFLFFAFLGFTIFGGHSIWVGVRNREPVQIDVPSLAFGTNQSSWLVVKDCEYIALDGVGWTNRLITSFQEVFIPVRANARDTNSPVPLLIATRDREIVEALNTLQRADGFVEKLKLLAETPALTFVKRDVTGLVRSRLELTDDDLQAYRTAFPTLIESFVILDEGESPSAIKGFLMLGCGFFFLFVAAALGLLVEKCTKGSNKVPPIIPPPVPPLLPRRS